uniref:Large ribosomal subunit protein eL19 n=1 Tax=uncultured euryarchaeote Rifle_16ft_4_minimus_10062 TaxID=1665186 RepID=A0A0H4T2Q3_9EURY|nr:50S ribosomal protein L19e [uncultured euryarchaeote Rifle_16ft_4_minimus_10062]
MNLRNQRRMAALILKCGVNRVWISPDKLEEVQEKITRGDLREAIAKNWIQKKPVVGQSRGRVRYHRRQREKGRQRGVGSRKGGTNARDPRKRRWIRMIRPVRAYLRELRAEGKIDTRTYREYYRQAKGGMFKGRAHLDQHLRAGGLIKGG